MTGPLLRCGYRTKGHHVGFGIPVLSLAGLLSSCCPSAIHNHCGAASCHRGFAVELRCDLQQWRCKPQHTVGTRPSMSCHQFGPRILVLFCSILAHCTTCVVSVGSWVEVDFVLDGVHASYAGLAVVWLPTRVALRLRVGSARAREQARGASAWRSVGARGPRSGGGWKMGAGEAGGTAVAFISPRGKLVLRLQVGWGEASALWSASATS